MEAQVRVVIYSVNNNIFDNLIITDNVVDDYKIYYQRLENSNLKNTPNYVNLKISRKGINAYLVSSYIYTLKISNYYRRAALKTLLEFCRSNLPQDNKKALIYIKLRMPRYQSLGYKWNERVTQMALERRELDHAMSWLSTLGGGFSALGETFQHCAEIAGKISVRQLQLALRLGDPLLVSRCKLWAALSLLQRGGLKVAKKIVIETYDLAIKEKDTRLQNMCKGVWAKLQYSYKIKKQNRRKL